LFDNIGYKTTNCPFCTERGRPTPDTKKHLYVYGPGRGVHCFRCNYHTSKWIPDEVADLVEWEGFDMGEGRGTVILRNSAEWHLRMAKPVAQFRKAKQYLNERGMEDNEIERLGLLYASSGDYARRIIFTIRGDKDGPVQYFTGRSIRASVKPKYKNAPVPKNGFLYMVGSGDRGVVCEGPFDAIRAAQAGYLGIGLLGKRINRQQARIIGTRCKTATVILDNDAFSSSIDAALTLSYYLPTTRKEVPAGTDLGDLDKATLRSIMESGGSIRAALYGEDDSPIYRGVR